MADTCASTSIVLIPDSPSSATQYRPNLSSTHARSHYTIHVHTQNAITEIANIFYPGRWRYRSIHWREMRRCSWTRTKTDFIILRSGLRMTLSTPPSLLMILGASLLCFSLRILQLCICLIFFVFSRPPSFSFFPFFSLSLLKLSPLFLAFCLSFFPFSSLAMFVFLLLAFVFVGFYWFVSSRTQAPPEWAVRYDMATLSSVRGGSLLSRLQGRGIEVFHTHTHITLHLCAFFSYLSVVRCDVRSVHSFKYNVTASAASTLRPSQLEV